MAKEKKELIVGVNGDLSDNFTTGQKAILGLQNTLAMCGVILVPILCGLDVSVTLFCAGIGTIIYQFIDKKMVPAFLGGSFAIIAGVSTVVGEMGIPYAQGGILGMAVFYLLFALLLKILGKDRVARVFPPIIVGPIIMVLGLSLASVGVQEAEANWPIAIITFLIAVGVNNFSKGLTRVMTIIIALVGGYLISIPFGLVDFTALKEAAWIGVPSFTLPQFSWRAIALIAPCAIVPCLEHIGDVMAVGTVVGKDFTHEPGLDRSVFACGVSTILSGCLGGPSLTIHSENTGVLAVTHLYSPTIVRFGALWMALLAFCPKFNALCGSIPQAVLGGVGILLYGMVTSTMYYKNSLKTVLTPQGLTYFDEKERALKKDVSIFSEKPLRKKYDVFISHANKDKLSYVNDLYSVLSDLGIEIFYDSKVLSWGDKWKDVILNGTEQSEFAIIVISENFFGREWTEKELNTFLEQENTSGQKIVLPLLYNVTINQLKAKYPALEEIQAISTSDYTKEQIAILFAQELIKRYK